MRKIDVGAFETQATRALIFPVYISSVLFISLIILATQVHLLHLFPWGDEYETIVVARMMATGARLYADIFDQHGPLTFLPGYILGRFGLASVINCRVFMLALQVCAMAIVFRFVWTLERRAAPLWLGFAAIWTTCVLPVRFGHAYLYQTMGAGLFSVALSTVCLPSFFGSRHVSGTWGFVGGACLGCLPFLAFTYDPAAALLFAASIRRTSARTILIGAATAVAFNIGWLIVFGDLKGYLIEHYYINLFVLPAYLDHADFSFKDVIIATFATTIVILAAVRAARGGTRLWRSILFVLAFLSLLGRGLNFQALAAYGFVLPASAAVLSQRWRWLRSNISGPIVGVGLSLLALLAWRPAWETNFKIRNSSPFSRFVDANTAPSDRILVYSFDNIEYILADRLPATADFFFLPSQATYDKQPTLGFKLDVCQRFIAANPKIVKLDRWRVYDRISWDSYGNCIEQYISSHYRQVLPHGVYIRRDISKIL